MSRSLRADEAKVLAFLTAKDIREPEEGWSPTTLANAMQRESVELKPKDNLTVILDALVSAGKLMTTRPRLTWRYFVV